jgi:hypothetical protein
MIWHSPSRRICRTSRRKHAPGWQLLKQDMPAQQRPEFLTGRVAAPQKCRSTVTAVCLPFADQFLSQLGSAPVSATLQVV